jgi:hypothetical protein
MTLKKPLVNDREQIPALDEPELIQLDETRLSKIAKATISAVGVLGGGLLTFLGLNNDTIEKQNPGLVLLGAGFLLAVSLLAWAIVASADIRARGVTTASNLALRTRPHVTIAPPGDAGKSSGLWCHIAGREKADLHLVVDSRVVGAKSEFLLARNDEMPRWYKQEEIDSWEVRSG